MGGQLDIRAEQIDPNFFFMIPNMIDRLGLSVYAFRLYCHYKRVVGESVTGACWQSQETVAAECKMSVRMVRNANHELERVGLVSVEVHKADGEANVVMVKNVWAQNAEVGGGSAGCAEGVGITGTGGRHDVPIKNTPLRTTHEENPLNPANGRSSNARKGKQPQPPPERDPIAERAVSLIKTFGRVRGISPAGPKEWNEWMQIARGMVAQGVTEEHVEQAIQTLQGKKLQCDHIRSCKNTAVGLAHPYEGKRITADAAPKSTRNVRAVQDWYKMKTGKEIQDADGRDGEVDDGNVIDVAAG